MDKWLKKLRGIIGTGAVWGTAGLSVGAILGAISSIIFDGGLSLAWVLTSGVGFGLFGSVSGVFFAGTLATLDGRRAFDELSARRAAVWGWIAGAGSAALFVLIRDGIVLPFLWERMLPPVAALSTLGACLGAGTILVARKATKELAPGTEESPNDPIESSDLSQLKRSGEAEDPDLASQGDLDAQ